MTEVERKPSLMTFKTELVPNTRLGCQRPCIAAGESSSRGFQTASVVIARRDEATSGPAVLDLKYCIHRNRPTGKVIFTEIRTFIKKR